MRKTNKIIVVTILVAMLLLGIGYAAIQNVTLNISGTVAADPSQSNFKVCFVTDPEPTVSDSTYVTAGVIDDINATINVSGLTIKGQIVSATYIVQNTSTDLSADLSVATTNSNTEYFTISSELADTSLKAGETTIVIVTVELTKTPISESVSSIVGVELTAVPVEPGQEGTSGTTNDYSQTPDEDVSSSITTLATLTTSNIGDYIDLGNNIVGTESTSDDWRMLYKDENAVYVILADYLPAEFVPDEANLYTDTSSYPYNVCSDIDRDALINGLLNTTAWSDFTNGITGALAMGSPTKELFFNSYKVKNGIELQNNIIDSSITDYDLYVPHTSVVENCNGYWLATSMEGTSDNVWYVNYNGGVGDDYYYHGYWNVGSSEFSSRPVVSLPLDTEIKLVDGIWEVIIEEENTLALVTNDNIGDYIDLGNDVIDNSLTETAGVTTDDWRILYKDEETVYVILADYLPAEQVPESTGFTQISDDSKYNVHVPPMASNNEYLSGLKNTTAWSNFTNGIVGATATGSPTAELLMNSYNTKNGTSLVYTDYPTLDDSSVDFDLYVPHTKVIEECMGYWLATSSDFSNYCMLGVFCNGQIYQESFDENYPDLCCRPVVSLPLDVAAELVDGVWTLVQ